MKVKIEELKKELESKMESYEEYITEYYNNQDDIYDIIHDIADNNVDIYTYDLMEWVKNYWEYVEQYVKEFGIDSNNFDFIGAVRGGQYLYIEEKLMENKNIMLEYLAYYILQYEGIEELEENKATEVSIMNFNNIDSITELEDELHEIIEEEEV